MAVLSHSVIYTGTPAYLSELISTSAGIRSTRSSNTANPVDPYQCQDVGSLNLHAPHNKLASETPSFRLASPAVWNSLPLKLRQITSSSAFRKALKTELYPT